jgi:hypothetical protein
MAVLSFGFRRVAFATSPPVECSGGAKAKRGAYVNDMNPGFA